MATLTKVDRLPGIFSATFKAITGFEELGPLTRQFLESLGEVDPVGSPIFLEPEVAVTVAITEAEYWSHSTDPGGYDVLLPQLPIGAVGWFMAGAGGQRLRADTASEKLEANLTYCDVGDRIWLRDENGEMHQIPKASFTVDDGVRQPKQYTGRRGHTVVDSENGLTVTPDFGALRIVDGDLTRR